MGETTKWCTTCKTKHKRIAFGPDRSRADGLAAHCLASRRTGRPRGWHGKPNVNPITGKPGPATKPGRDGDRLQARARINQLVRKGLLARPDNVECTDCGHYDPGGTRRHEYDHHKGYAAQHHYDVEPVCTKCHRLREVKRQQIPGMKWCTSCKEHHLMDYFGKDRSRGDGLMQRCRNAESERAKQKWATRQAPNPIEPPKRQGSLRLL